MVNMYRKSLPLDIGEILSEFTQVEAELTHVA